MTGPDDQVDTRALAAWLDDNVPALAGGELATTVVTGGSTNLILRLDREGRRAILRSPGTAGGPQGAKTLDREAMVLRALTGTDVPSPAFFGHCPDPAVIGVPFFVMEDVDGWAATVTPENTTTYPPYWAQGPDHHYLGYAMVDGLIAMANLDWRAAGLEGFGKADNFLARQPDRWLGAIESYPKLYPEYQVRDLPGLSYVADWLRANIPAGSTPGLMHADYALNNVLFAHRPPARLVAIIDWETATIGDPLLDLAAFTQNLRTGDGDDGGTRYFDPANFPLRADAVDYYGERTGRDVSGIDYYYVLSRFRSACMLEYKVAEAIQGLSSKAKGDRFDGLVRGLLRDAEALARSLG
ncbi:phosphotransferase family protein [Trujillonella humicola]|uniref:phosphotransferase family protein n=1 Tax=Trujillonella humicola TaxID=3383699 RepID=UPI003906D117